MKINEKELKMTEMKENCISFTNPEPKERLRLSDNEIVFKSSDEKEVLRLDADGSFYVQGNKVAEDIEVYHAFKKWLEYSIGKTEDKE